MVMRVFLAGIFAVLVSCAATPQIKDGDPVSVLYTKRKANRKKADNLGVHVTSVDGKRIGVSKSVRLSPGKHTLKISYYHTWGGIVGSAVNGNDEMTVDLLNGGVYRLEGQGNQKHGVVQLVDVNSGKVIKSKRVTYQKPVTANETLLQDFTNQMMIPYSTGVY